MPIFRTNHRTGYYRYRNAATITQIATAIAEYSAKCRSNDLQAVPSSAGSNASCFRSHAARSVKSGGTNNDVTRKAYSPELRGCGLGTSGSNTKPKTDASMATDRTTHRNSRTTSEFIETFMPEAVYADSKPSSTIALYNRASHSLSRIGIVVQQRISRLCLRT